jgi:hypothetical protein
MLAVVLCAQLNPVPGAGLPGAQPAFEQESARPSERQPSPPLTVRVVDETGVGVTSARVTLTPLQPASASAPIRGETDAAGWREFPALAPGLYHLRAEKEGFYAAHRESLQIGEPQTLEVTLHHQQELADAVNVTDSPQAIDPAQTAAAESLDFREIINLPYPVTRDIRSALPFIPGVVADATGQIHVGGAETYQIYNALDGFNISHPASGLLELRVSADALREVEIQSSRYSAEYGKASGGVLSLTTGMGDDRYRFTATNFIPSFQTRKGFAVSDWTPRATIGGPLRKKRAWFFNAAEAEYQLDVLDELPAGADRKSVWRWGNLARAQVNLTPANILTASLLVNQFRASRAGLSRFEPEEATRELRQSAYHFAVKDQALLPRRLLLETGFGLTEFRAAETPFAAGSPYVIHPGGRGGNFFRTTDGAARRLQGFANITLPALDLAGRHEFKLGLDLNRVVYDQLAARQPVLILREDDTPARRVTFEASGRFRRHNTEVSVFAQDRWSPSDRLLIESGIRLDRDQIVRRVAVSPRIASTYLLTRDGETRLAAGGGVFHDATNLELITRPLAGRRFDVFYEADGRTAQGSPRATSFQLDPQRLRVPRFVNWSVSLERRLPASVYLRVELMQKRGSRGFTYINGGEGGAQGSVFRLESARRDRFDSAQVTVRKALGDGYEVLAAYTRSAARSNAVLDFTLDDPIFSPQAGGPLPWDAPNRLLSWGWLPLVKGFDLSYALDWRDGFPFSLVNQEQRLVGPPGARRFPDYFALNVHLERRFRLFGLNWAVRGGFNNVTGRPNPSVVNNNVDSPQFLTYGGIQRRAFTARIRLLGRK